VKVLLRVVLTLLLVVLGLEVGIKLAPRLASWTGDGLRSPVSPVRAAQPDWGGGSLVLSDRSATGAIDSVKMASGREQSRTQTYSGSSGGVLLRRKSDSDYALTMAVGSSGTSGRTALFEVPSSGHFRKELLPGNGDAEAPAADIPLYPQSSCRTQVGRGTACFVGFYLTPDSVEAVRSFYVRVLSQLGWQRVNAGRPGLVETFAKGNEDRTVVVQLRRQDPATTRIGLVAMTSGSPDRSERK
jgi:hypothetical protein